MPSVSIPNRRNEIPRASRGKPASSERAPVLRWIAGAIAVLLLGFVTYVRLLMPPQGVAPPTAAAEASGPTVAQIAAANRKAREQAEAQEAQERADRAAAERERNAALQAQIDRRSAKEDAWARYYHPSRACQSAEELGSLDCVNEHLRAKTAFERKWEAGELR